MERLALLIIFCFQKDSFCTLERLSLLPGMTHSDHWRDSLYLMERLTMLSGNTMFTGKIIYWNDSLCSLERFTLLSVKTLLIRKTYTADQKDSLCSLERRFMERLTLFIGKTRFVLWKDCLPERLSFMERHSAQQHFHLTPIPPLQVTLRAFTPYVRHFPYLPGLSKYNVTQITFTTRIK